MTTQTGTDIKPRTGCPGWSNARGDEWLKAPGDRHFDDLSAPARRMRAWSASPSYRTAMSGARILATDPVMRSELLRRPPNTGILSLTSPQVCSCVCGCGHSCPLSVSVGFGDLWRGTHILTARGHQDVLPEAIRASAPSAVRVSIADVVAHRPQAGPAHVCTSVGTATPGLLAVKTPYALGWMSDGATQVAADRSARAPALVAATATPDSVDPP